MEIKEILAKVESAVVPKVNKVAVAYSGGLDSTLAVEMLRRKYKAKEIIPITVDVGQGADEIAEARRKAEIMKFEMILVDAREEFATDWLPKAIRANSDYNGYPVSTSMTRQLVARIVAQEGTKRGCDAVMEGSTGKGNDQYRMHNTFKLFAPHMEVLAYVRDFDLTRKEEELICEAWGVPTYERITGGDDKTMWCRSIASGAVDLNQELPEDIWQWLTPSRKAPESGEAVTLRFVEGIPIEMNGRGMPLDELIAELNVVAGRNGVGYIDMFEDGIMDLKSREIYEAPAAHVILKLHRDLEQACLPKDLVQFKKMVDAKWAFLSYHGMWYHPL